MKFALRLRRTDLGAALLAAGTYFAIALYLTHGAWHPPSTEVVGANGDAPQNAWFLAWVAFAISHGTDPLVVTYLSPPGHPLGLMWQDAAPLLGIVLAPVTISVGATFAYNLGVTLGMGLSATSAYLTIRSITRYRGPAWVGGLIFGFSPWIVGEASDGHLFLVNLWLVPPLFYFLVRVLRRDPRRISDAVALGAIAAAQLLISQEILVDCLLVSALVASGFTVANWQRLGYWCLYAARDIALAAATFAILAGVPLGTALFGPEHGLHGALESPFGSFDDLLTLVVPNASRLLSLPSLASLAKGLEPGFGPKLYLGLPLVLLTGWAGWRYRADRWILGSALVAGASALLALGPVLTVAGVRTGIPLPWTALVRLPLLSVMVPDRMGCLVFLAVALCFALVLDRYWPPRLDARIAWPAALAVVAIVPLAPAGPLSTWIVPTPAFFTSGSSLLVVPKGSEVAIAGPNVRYNVDAMVWQADSDFRFRLPWGYAITGASDGRRIPAGPDGTLGALWSRTESGQSAATGASVIAGVKANLCSWDVRIVVVGPVPNRALVVSTTSKVLGRGPTSRKGVALWTLPARWCGAP